MLTLSQSCDWERQTCDCQGLSHMSSLASPTDHLGREGRELQEEEDREVGAASTEATGIPSSVDCPQSPLWQFGLSPGVVHPGSNISPTNVSRKFKWGPTERPFMK